MSLIFKTCDLSYFLGKVFFGNDSFQNMFVHQPTSNTLELKEDKGTEYVISWKSKGVYTSKLKPLYTAFLHSINLSGYRMGIKFDKDSSCGSKQLRKIKTKVVNAYIVYGLDTWLKIPLINFKFKKCFFGATNIVKNSAKEKWMYISHGIALMEQVHAIFVTALLGMLYFLVLIIVPHLILKIPRIIFSIT